ncbi:LCP family protein [Desmospora activa]|uniref:LytR family transcriptional attenuator n=1 Tax=Desmospora activa DSM 45169 TaxID=1121389 RepID=A0A2T4Z493_9BACL|nr:LCP family protein [Desmospora activa]PTM56707.1 LytR family transcriptional attenuator [Desmospora activa DSM 45169]
MYRWVSFFVAILALLTGGVLLSQGTRDDVHPPITPAQPEHRQTSDKETTSQNTRSQLILPTPVKKPVSVLLMGVDRRKNDKGRTDAIMLIILNPRNERLTLLNIPRDAKAQLHLGGGRQRWDKINHAYALGNGVKSTVQTVESFLNIPVHHYLKMDMAGFRRIVDQMGGVDVQVPKTFSYKGQHFHKGSMHLNGIQALAYIRDRTGGSDYDRHIRQQQVLRELWKQSTQASTMLKLRDIIPTVFHHVETDLSPWDIWRMVSTLRTLSPNQMQVLHMKGVDEWSNHYYLVIPQNEQKRIQNILRQELESN